MAWRIGEQGAPIRQRIQFCRVRKFVDKGFDKESMPRGFDAAPWADWNVRRHLGYAITLICYAVGDVCFAVGATVRRVVANPYRRHALGIESRAHAIHDIRAIVIVLHILFARRSEERRVGKGVDLGGRRSMKKKKIQIDKE